MLLDLLVNAVRRGDANQLIGLLDLDEIDNEGRTALMLAAGKCLLHIVKILLENGARLHLLDKHQNSALVYAVRGGHKGIVLMLLKHGAKIYDYVSTSLISIIVYLCIAGC